MKAIRGVGIAIISFVILFSVIGLLLPETKTINRELWLQADQEKLDSLFHNPINWMLWHPQLINNDRVKLESSGYGVLGQLIVTTNEGLYSVLKVDSIGQGYFSYKTTIGKLEKEKISSISIHKYQYNEGSMVLSITKSFYLGANPVYRFFGLGFDAIFGDEIEAELNTIKSIISQ
jgi:hypothetical protein